MMTDVDISTLLAAMSIPSAITGFCFWLIEQKMQKRNEDEKKEREARQKRVDEREEAREKSELYLMQSIDATIILCEATARAVQRIPDAKCNGDMHKALDDVQQIKEEQEKFLHGQAIKHIY